MSTVSGAPGPRISAGWARIASATLAPPSSSVKRENAYAIRSRGSAKLTTPHPSIAVGISPSRRSAAAATSASIACCTGWSGSR